MAKVDRSGILKATLTNSFPPKIKAIVETSKKTLDRKKKTSNFLSMTYFGSWQNSFFCLRHIKIYIESNFNSIQMSHKLGLKKSSRFWYAMRTASRQISWRLTNNSGESDNNQRQMYSNVFYCQIKRCWRPQM